MWQHPEKKTLLSRIARLTGLSLLSGIAFGAAWGQYDASNVARVSFVQGSVQLQAGPGAGFQQAVMNMPVIEGSRLQTGGDGQVEIEFGDGSVSRLTPNSSLQFDHLGQDQVLLEPLTGLAYYELNVGPGHAPFGLQFSNVNVQPTANSILRIGLDSGWEVAVVAGSVNVQGNGVPPVAAAAGQSLRSAPGDSGAPYTLAQGINGDSWDDWNQDRDQVIAQEAAQQTPVRDDSGNAQSESWNDLDADGNWYPVEGAGNVWVPAGVDDGWDPYGAGYWGYYPSLGYTWISAYPWGWLPYHCGAWNYYSFGWGWAPGGGCGRTWSPVTVVRVHPPGWSMPVRPRPPGGIYPVGGQRLIAVDRGPVARGPWGYQGSRPRPDHLQTLSFRGTAITPVPRVDMRSPGSAAARGTSPGTRAVLGAGSPAPAPASQMQRPGYAGAYTRSPNVPRSVQAPGQPQMGQPPPPARSEMVRPVERPNVGYPAVQNITPRTNYAPREPAPPAHYSPPPAPPSHMQAPPPMHAAPAHR